tara:strand:- start:99 stop:467 length:369 start_codon:yes stop_codon:yes gene_type:complete
MAFQYTELSDVIRGDTMGVSLYIKDSTTSAPISVVGYTVTLTVKLSPDDTDLQAAAQVVRLLPDDAQAQAGQIALVVPADVTALFEPGNYWYDIQYAAPQGASVKTIAIGRFRVRSDITRSF